MLNKITFFFLLLPNIPKFTEIASTVLLVLYNKNPSSSFTHLIMIEFVLQNQAHLIENLQHNSHQRGIVPKINKRLSERRDSIWE